LAKIFAICLGFVATCSAAIAAVQQVSGGILTGARGVIVQGASYDVAFIDGSCASLCSLSIPFVDEAAGRAAANALLDQVLLDSSTGNFDTQPALTLGCTSSTRCEVITPALPNLRVLTYNDPSIAGDGIILTTTSIIFDDFDTSGADYAVYAIWSVPEASTGAMTFAGVAALMLIGRRRLGLT
jgi:hypothetical protein